MIRTIVDGGINWDWYWCGDFNAEEKTVHIFYHKRWHKYENRPKHEIIKGRVEALEDDKRIVYGLRLEGIEYVVTNPAQIFSYRDMTHYVREW